MPLKFKNKDARIERLTTINQRGCNKFTIGIIQIQALLKNSNLFNTSCHNKPIMIHLVYTYTIQSLQLYCVQLRLNLDTNNNNPHSHKKINRRVATI